MGTADGTAAGVRTDSGANRERLAQLGREVAAFCGVPFRQEPSRLG